MNLIDFQFQRSKIKVTIDKSGNNLLNIAESKMFSVFLYAVFRRDVLWYGDVRPGLRPSIRLSVRPGLRPPIFRTFLLHALTY